MVYLAATKTMEKKQNKQKEKNQPNGENTLVVCIPLT